MRFMTVFVVVFVATMACSLAFGHEFPGYADPECPRGCYELWDSWKHQHGRWHSEAMAVQEATNTIVDYQRTLHELQYALVGHLASCQPCTVLPLCAWARNVEAVHTYLVVQIIWWEDERDRHMEYMHQHAQRMDDLETDFLSNLTNRYCTCLASPTQNVETEYRALGE